MLSRYKKSLGIALAGALTVSVFSAVPATASESTPTTTLNGFRNVGYYGQWRATGEIGATVKKTFVDSGQAANLTHINYSFGNVAGSQEHLDAARAAGARGLDEVEPYTCFISDTPAAGPGQTETAGDADSDFLHQFTASESVLGIKDNAKQKLAGNFNQLAQLKRLYPDLKVNISLGGWSWSKSFSPAVATAESRTKLAKSCIDLYIRGNLPEINGRGGDGVAAGIFDGFDLDWEWPGAPDWSQEVGNHVDTVNDKANFIAFAAELRSQLDALEGETGAEYEISAFLPASPGVISAGGWNTPELWESLDYGNLQGYDLWGTWDARTGHQGNIYGDPANNWGLGLDTIVNSYVSAGVDPAKLNLGLAGYAQVWKDAEPQPWTTSGGGIGQITWDAMKAENLTYHHEYTADGKFNATWAYDEDARTYWSFDDQVAVAEKAKWAIGLGLGGVDFWEVGNDVAGDLSGASAQVFRAQANGPVTGSDSLICAATEGTTAVPWNATVKYKKGSQIFLDGKIYVAKNTVKGKVPGPKKNGWVELTECGVKPVDSKQPGKSDGKGKGKQHAAPAKGHGKNK